MDAFFYKRTTRIRKKTAYISLKKNKNSMFGPKKKTQKETKKSKLLTI